MPALKLTAAGKRGGKETKVSRTNPDGRGYKEERGRCSFQRRTERNEAKGSARSTECEHERGAQCTEHSDGSSELKV